MKGNELKTSGSDSVKKKNKKKNKKFKHQTQRTVSERIKKNHSNPDENKNDFIFCHYYPATTRSLPSARSFAMKFHCPLTSNSCTDDVQAHAESPM